MEVEILSPQGYCAGVTNAINMARLAKKEHLDKNVYVLGMLVHNKEVIDELTKENIITIYDKNKTYEELIKLIPNDSVIIFTAHGHDEKLDAIAKSKNLIIYDATCSKVKRNLIRIKEAINNNRDVIYIGEKNHPESLASLSISNKVSFYDKDLDLSKLNNPLVINQTTLNILSLKDIHNDILSKINAEIEDEICPTTRLRQEAIEKLDDSFDLIIVVGDIASNNSKKLLEIAKTSHPHTSSIMISSLNEFDKEMLKNKKKVALASGASTPNKTINDIYSFIKNY